MLTGFLLLFAAGVTAGFLGALVGIGGGVIIVTILTLYLHLPIHIAIAVSLVCVMATSIAGSLRYVKQRIADVRLGMFLEIATTSGALAGAFIGVLLSAYMLSLIFGAFLLYTAARSMPGKNKRGFDGRSHDWESKKHEADSELDRDSKGILESGTYYDKFLKASVDYRPVRPIIGPLVMSFGGLASGLLGVGGGIFNVASINSIMRVPLKVSIATSQFMIAVTAATGAIVYFLAGGINFQVVGPAAIGTMLGSTLGSLSMNRLPVRVVKTIFVIILIYFGYQMIGKGFLMGFRIKFPGFA